MPKYITLVFMLFMLLYYPVTPIATFVNAFQTESTVFILKMLLEPFQVVGHKILISNVYSLVVTQACNGMIPLLMFYASVLAFTGPLMYKLKWMLAGYIIIFVINVLRIWFVAYFTQSFGRSFFFLAHDLAGNILLVITGTILFIFYVKYLPRNG